jgi:UDP-glucose 4-epimerase
MPENKFSFITFRLCVKNKRMNIVVTGGAGFIGSNLVDRLMAQGHRVTVIDNLTGGRKEFFEHHLGAARFAFHCVDVRNTEALKEILSPEVDLVYHLAANADISRGVEDPTLDFENTIVATFSLLQAMRTHGIKKLFYTSGSGVYGDRGIKYSSETFGPLEPVSMYGSAKLSGEGLISAFAHLYDMQAWIFRPANIIGPRATHGVVYDFIRRLKQNPNELRILGDGKQSKAYLHVDDVLDAVFLAQEKMTQGRVNFFNLSSNSFITVNEIAELSIQAMGLKQIKKKHTGGKIGWKGDVAIVRLRNTRLKNLGWSPKYSSKKAVKATIQSLLQDLRMSSSL